MKSAPAASAAVLSGTLAVLLGTLGAGTLPGSPASAQILPAPAPQQARLTPPARTGAPIPATARAAGPGAVKVPAAGLAAVKISAAGPVRTTEGISVPEAGRGPVLLVLPRALPIVDTASSTLFSALLAIARAREIDPQAAQTASFQYTQAVQQYRSGNIAGARVSALQALSTANTAQVVVATPAPALSPVPVAPVQLPGLAGGLYGADAPAIDADAFLALARGTIEDCAARRDGRLGGAKQHYTQAQQDFAQRNWEATRIDAKAAIDACSKSRK